MTARDDDTTPRPPPEPVSGLLAAPAPESDLQRASPDKLESYVRAAMHQERSPGTVLVIAHPLRLSRVPRPLLDALAARGHDVRMVHTQPDRAESVDGIRQALLDARSTDSPLDVLVISGDGSLDHHVLIAAFLAFYPDLICARAGAIDTSAVTADDLATLPHAARDWLRPLPTGEGLTPDEATIKDLWVLRAIVDRPLRAGRSVARIARAAGRSAADPALRVAALAAWLPDKVVLRAHGYDLSGLARATQERTFQGLYPFIRSIACYPAGTAADNALFAGVPGWMYARFSGVLSRFAFLDGLRRRWEARLTRRLVEYFCDTGAVVPARLSIVGFDGDWQALCSHAAGGPGGGHFFSADLTSKTGGLLGYLARIPQVTVGEGLLGSTIVRVRATRADGSVKLDVEDRLAEGLFTNRTFIAGVGSVPTTDPTSFAGRSSLIIAPPILARGRDGRRHIDLRGFATFTEAIVKGLLARAVFFVGLNPGALASGGKLRMASPEHQVALKEGEEVDMAYLDPERVPRFVPVQVSGDPFQATRMTIRVAWGPLPLLAHPRSLLMTAAQRTLAHLRTAQTWRLETEVIFGLRTFRHRVGQDWSTQRAKETGLPTPLRTLPRSLDRAQQQLLDRWSGLGVGPFVDTSEQGLGLGRRGRYAHASDHRAPLVVVRVRRGTLLVRMVRAHPDNADILESRTTYRAFAGWWVIHESQTRSWSADEAPRIVAEEHFFRDAEAFRQDAPRFFPFTGSADQPKLTDRHPDDP